jgi:hypothetical protein
MCSKSLAGKLTNPRQRTRDLRHARCTKGFALEVEREARTQKAECDPRLEIPQPPTGMM